MKRLILGIVFLSIIGGLAYWRAHRNAAPLEQVYAGARKVTVFSSNAQVKQTLAEASFGDRLEVLSRSGDAVQVRTAAGIEGWANSRDLMSADIWQRTRDMTAEARKSTVQAQGHTKVLTNLRIEPGRDAERVFQLPRDTAISMLKRSSVDVPVTSNGSAADDENSSEPLTTRKEDWLLVLAHTKDVGDVAGWVVGRFVALDLPQPLPDYTSSAGMRVTGYLELNRVADKGGQTRPQYLVFGTHGTEGDACDFVTLRVFTWGNKRSRYETAFVDSGFCGQMPVEVTPATQPGGDATFHFMTVGTSGKQERAYRMHQTVVRRTDENRGKASGKSSKSSTKSGSAKSAKPKNTTKHK